MAGTFTNLHHHFVFSTKYRLPLNHKEHHRTQTFQDEFLRFLELHEIEYDERFIWK